jgi:hypothetical protein
MTVCSINFGSNSNFFNDKGKEYKTMTNYYIEQDDYCLGYGNPIDECECDNVCSNCGLLLSDCGCDKEENNVKYPHITVNLLGQDGNAFSILGNVTRAMRRAGLSKEEIDNFQNEAMSGDYDTLLVTCMKWVNIQ